MTTAQSTSDLSVCRDTIGVVESVDEVGGGILELSLHCPYVATTATPGQFVQLRVPGKYPLLRRPFSIAWIAEETCGFVFEPSGLGTQRFATMRKGEEVEVLGPLGIGFSTPPSLRSIVCVAGGLGCAPFPFVVERAAAAGVNNIVILHGAATASRLYPADRFRRGHGNVTVIEATDDGSRGHRGRVTELLASSVGDDVDAVYGCGPNPMLASLARELDAHAGTPTIVEVSMEAPMGCGFGICLGCVIPVHGNAPWALCCRNGAVMPASSIDWDRLAALPPPGVA